MTIATNDHTNDCNNDRDQRWHVWSWQRLWWTFASSTPMKIAMNDFMLDSKSNQEQWSKRGDRRLERLHQWIDEIDKHDVRYQITFSVTSKSLLIFVFQQGGFLCWLDFSLVSTFASRSLNFHSQLSFLIVILKCHHTRHTRILMLFLLVD